MDTQPLLRGTLLACLAIFSLGSLAAAHPPVPAPAGEKTPTATLTPTPTGTRFPRLLRVETLLQSRYTSCGEAVITMAYNYANPETPLLEEDVIEFAVEEGLFTERRWPFTSPEDMVEIASHYADGVRTGNVTTQEEGLALLVEQLREGEPVIIDVLVRLYDPDSAPHFILVTGISVDPKKGVLIHYNDPLSGKAWAHRWDGNEGVWHAWKTNSDPGGPGWWLVIPPP